MGEPQPLSDEDGNDIFVDELKAGAELMHGQYTIESFLNAGGFGITYRARDSLDRQVVIKECFPGAFCRRSRYLVNARSRAHQNELESIVRLFVQEARSLSKLDHPNIVGVHNVFEENNTAYMALDFVEGRDLLDIIEDEATQLKPAQLTKILKELLGAVGFVHDQGILHRDISPDNILINDEMSPVLIDFGAAREQATKQSRVLSALRVVKDGYSPQEFYIQGSDQGPFSDLYALGASFYHVIHGDLPANSQVRLAAIASGQPDPYEPLKGRFDEYDENFLTSIDMSLAVLPKDRLQSAGEWLAKMEGRAPTAASLGATLTQTTAAAPEKKKSKGGFWLATTAVAALIVGGIVATQTDVLSGGGADVADTQTDAPTAPTTPTETSAVSETDAATPELEVATEESPAAIVPTEETGTDDVAVAETEIGETGAAEETEVVAADPVEAPIEAPVEEVTFAETDTALTDLPEDAVVAAIDETVDVAPETEAVVADLPEVAVAETDTALTDVPEDAAVAAVEDVVDPAPLTEIGLPVEPTAPFAEEIEAPDLAAINLPPLDPDLADTVSTLATLVTDEEFIGPPVPEIRVEDPAAVVIADEATEVETASPLDEVAVSGVEETPEAADPTFEPETLATEVEIADPLVESPFLEVETPAGEIEVASVDPDALSFPLRPIVRPEPPVVEEVVVLPEPVATPSMPTDTTTAGNDLAGSPEAPVLPAMAQLPLLPVETSQPRGVPSVELPVFPFAAEVVDPAVDAATAMVQTAATAVLPFDGLFDADENETRIFSVNGVDVDTLSQFNAVVRDALPLETLTEVTLTVGTGLTGGSDVTEQELVLPVAQDTQLLNGMVFRSLPEGDGWVTIVLDAPEDAAGDLQAGDRLLAYVPTTELLRDRRSLADLLTREIEQGTVEFSFAVMRNNSTWVASLIYENPLLEPQD